MRVFLVRHGQSQANADPSANAHIADHALKLTEDGHEQARAAGTALAEWFSTSFISGDDQGRYVRIPRIRCWHSPYTRTRQTAADLVSTCVLPPRSVAGNGMEYSIRNINEADALNGSLGRNAGDSWFLDPNDPDEPVPHAREHLLLHEQQFGLFDGLSDEEREEQFPREHAYYMKCRDAQGKMWPKMPQGESRADVCMRVHQSFGTFHRDASRHGIKNIVIVGHGTTNRAFVTMWLHKRWEWMHEERNPLNCSIRMIEDGVDKGYIFDGFKGGQHAGQ